MFKNGLVKNFYDLLFTNSTNFLFKVREHKLLIQDEEMVKKKNILFPDSKGAYNFFLNTNHMLKNLKNDRVYINPIYKMFKKHIFQIKCSKK